MESLPIAVIAYDQDGNVLLSNSRAQNLLAKSEYRYEGKSLSALLEESLKNQKVFYDPIRLLDGRSRRLDVELGVWRLLDEDQKPWGVLCTIDDITYRKMMEEQAVQDEKLVYAGKLAAELAHGSATRWRASGWGFRWWSAILLRKPTGSCAKRSSARWTASTCSSRTYAI